MQFSNLSQGPGSALNPMRQAIETALREEAMTYRWFPNMSIAWEQAFDILALLLLIVIIAWATQGLRKFVIVPMIRRTKYVWDDVLVDKALFRWISYMLPTLIATAAIEYLPGLDPALDNSVTIVTIARQVLVAMTTMSCTLAVGALLDAIHEIYSLRSGPNQRPIKGYISLVKIFIFVLGTVTAVASLFGKDPTGLLTGIGAMTAVLMLVFKDTILSLVASITLTQNDMIRLGDWIELPGSADGDVVDMALHTVKIQNFDRTISTVPTIDLVNKPFKNWRNMSQGDGRRIKRALYLDAASVRFLSKQEVEAYGELSVLNDYVSEKLPHLNACDKVSKASLEGRRLTNLGTFRAYVLQWLRQHPQIHQEMTMLVRQLAPGPSGVPLEIYAFTRTTNWSDYEDIMADIFDFLLAAVQEFDLRLFQTPTGQDVRTIASDSPQHAN